MESEKIRRKIIYVDDVSYNLTSVKNRLKDHYTIYPAQSVSSMFDILDNVEPDLILLDINMPGMNGYDAIKKLKSDSRYSAIPVIFLTSRDDRESVYEGLKLGAVGYVRKPFSDPELIGHIENQFDPDSSKKKKDRPSIIYVDDVNYNLATVKSRIKEYFTVYPAQSVFTMFEIIDLVKPDLILLDINMPDMSGYDAIKQLKADARYANIPIIFLTSRDDEDSILEGIKLGAVDYVSKSFSDNELINRINNQLGVKEPEEVVEAEDIKDIETIL